MKKKIITVYNPQDYGFGGVIQALAPFAGLAAAIPGVGPLAALGIKGASMAMGTIGGAMEKKNALDEQEEQLALQKQQAAWASAKSGQAGIVNQYQSTFPYGGMVPGMTPVELEKQEVFQTPDGQMGQVDFPSHGQGGGDMSLPAGTFVWSDKLKTASGRTFADEAAYLGKLKSKYERILNS